MDKKPIYHTRTTIHLFLSPRLFSLQAAAKPTFFSWCILHQMNCLALQFCDKTELQYISGKGFVRLPIHTLLLLRPQLPYTE